MKALPPGIAYKRSYFIDWVVANKHKANLLPSIDWIVDEQHPESPAILSGAGLRRGLTKSPTVVSVSAPGLNRVPGVGNGFEIKFPTCRRMFQTMPGHLN